MEKHYTVGQIGEAIADVRRVKEELDEQIVGINRLLWRIQEEGEHAGSLSAVRPYSEIEADEEAARKLLRGLRAKRSRCESRLAELEDARREMQLALARAKREALIERDARKARKARVSG